MCDYLELLYKEMAKANFNLVTLVVTLLLLAETWAQSARKRQVNPKPTKTQCCDEVRSLKIQVANLTSLLEELSRKQQTDMMNVVRQIMDLDKQNRLQEDRVTEAEMRYSEIHNRVEIMQLQSLQSAPQTSSGEQKHSTINRVEIKCYSANSFMCNVLSFIRSLQEL